MNFSYDGNVEMQQPQNLNKNDFPDFTLYKRGYHKDHYDFGDELLVVATDRFTHCPASPGEILPGIGLVRNQMSIYWFRKLSAIFPNHFISSDIKDFPELCQRYARQLDGRSMLVKKTTPLPFSCVVHGYLTGAGWQEYQEFGTMFGFGLPAGMVESQRLPVPFFVPLIQGEAPETGFAALEEYCGRILAENLRTAALRLFIKAWKLARARGVLLVESTFEFGLCEGELHLIDECITLEKSQFWDVKTYKVGESLPGVILNNPYGNQGLHGAQQQSLRSYLDLYQKLTGQKL